MILNPKKDTVTICLPPDWVGQSVVCILKKNEYKPTIPTLPELHDVSTSYNTQVRKRQAQKEQYLRRKRLRKSNKSKSASSNAIQPLSDA